MLATTSKSGGLIHAGSEISINRASDFSQSYSEFSQSYDGISRVAGEFCKGPLRKVCPNISEGSNARADTSCVRSDNSVCRGREFLRDATGSISMTLECHTSRDWTDDFFNAPRNALTRRRLLLPALKRGRVTITFSNKSSSFDILGASISQFVCIILTIEPFVHALLRRRDNEHGILPQRKGVMS